MDNDLAIRRYITEQMFEGWLENWYDEEIDIITTREKFQEAISLSLIWILEDRSASLLYNDGNLFGGHSIDLSVEVGGQFPYPPQLVG